MQSSESEHLSDDSGAGDDPHRSSAVPNSLLQLQCAYASDSDSVVAATPEKQFEEEDGLSDGSEFHTPAQPSKRRRLSSVSPVQKRQVDVQDVDSDGFDRDSLFDPPSTRKRGFKRQRMPWSRLLRNGPLLTTIERLSTKKSRQLWHSLWTMPGQNHLSSPMRIPLPDGDRSR
jgi:hypothetical protein